MRQIFCLSELYVRTQTGAENRSARCNIRMSPAVFLQVRSGLSHPSSGGTDWFEQTLGWLDCFVLRNLEKKVLEGNAGLGMKVSPIICVDAPEMFSSIGIQYIVFLSELLICSELFRLLSFSQIKAKLLKHTHTHKWLKELYYGLFSCNHPSV